jgi:site-specific recombinase XerD
MINEATSLAAYAASWRRTLRAQNRSPRTIETYLLAVNQFDTWLGEVGGPSHSSDVERSDVEGFIEYVLSNRSPGTAKQRYMSLRGFFAWLVEEEEIDASPMEKMKPPKVEEKPPPILRPEELRALIDASSGSAFDDRRDASIVMLLADTGMRSSELVGLTVEDIELDLRVAHVIGKGGKHRAAPFGDQTTLALDRYLRSRAAHPHARRDELFLGKRGPITRSGLGQIVKKRGNQAGIEGMHPHLLRHTFVHRWLAAGGQEGDVVRILGWSRKSAAQMLDRYGASAATERAFEAHRRFGPVDSL